VRTYSKRTSEVVKAIAPVIPPAKYSCCGSPERFSSGSTARDRMGPTLGMAKSRVPGELDIDSDTPVGFTEEDRELLEAVAEILAAKL
jgi:hypothetical protein